MGCMSSKSDEHCRSNVFHVWNVDDMGNRFNAGKIIITDTDLVLYQRGKVAVKWPMRSLRRYGFDSELFSFESGRRCPTGPGVYAFRCRRAEALFTLLQEHIQRFGHIAPSANEEQSSVQPLATSVSLVNVDDPQRQTEEIGIGSNNQEPRYCGCPCPSLSTTTASGHEILQPPSSQLDVITTETNHYVNGDVVQLECSNADTVKEHEYVNTVVFPKNNPKMQPTISEVGLEHEYVNTGILAESASSANVDQAPTRVGDVNANTTIKTQNDRMESSPPSYCNIPTPTNRPSKPPLASQGSLSGSSAMFTDTFANSNSDNFTSKSIHVNGKKLKQDPFYSNLGPMAPSTSNSTPVATPQKTVNYVVLDLNGAEASNGEVLNDLGELERESACPNDLIDDANNGKGYVTIDFDKTAALLYSTTNRQKQNVEILKKSQSDSMSK